MEAAETSLASLGPLATGFAAAAEAAAEMAAASSAARAAIAEGEASVARFAAQLATSNVFLEAVIGEDGDAEGPSDACQLRQGAIGGSYDIYFDINSIKSPTDTSRRLLLQVGTRWPSHLLKRRCH